MLFSWNISPAQVGCMRQALGPGALGRPGGSGWRGRWEGGTGWGRHVNSRPFHFNVWQNSLQIKKKKSPFYICIYLLLRVCLLEEKFKGICLWKKKQAKKPRTAGGRLRLRESQVEQIRQGGLSQATSGVLQEQGQLNWEMIEEVTKILLPVARKKLF